MKNLQMKSSTRVYHKSQIRQPHPTYALVTKSGSASASSNDSKKVTMQDVFHRNSSTQAYHKSQSRQHPTYAPVTKSGSTSASSNDSKRNIMQYVCHVQNLIERCLQLFMEKDEVVKTLLTQAKIEPEFTNAVWQRLEEENADFFRAYYISLKLKKQILLFNQMIKNQYQLMKCSFPITVLEPLAPGQNGIHSIPVNNLPMEYPVLQKPSIPAAYQPHLDSMGGGISSCHVVSGIPAPSNLPMRYPLLQQPSIPAAYQPHLDSMGGGISSCHVVSGIPAPSIFPPIQTNSGNGMVMDHSALYMAPFIPSNSAMSSLLEMPVNPTSVASSGYPVIPSNGAMSSLLEMPMNPTSVASSGYPVIPPNGVMSSLLEMTVSPTSVASNGYFPFIASEISGMSRDTWAMDTADLPELGDFVAELGNNHGSPFMQFDSDILLESSVQKGIGNGDDFVNSKPPGSQTGEIVSDGMASQIGFSPVCSTSPADFFFVDPISVNATAYNISYKKIRCTTEEDPKVFD